ncbi:MAG: hypothetical protein JXA25_12315 [Anaerolineales bacterium]|nr:hypothetical protein [Anaerolineales bacterium]
MLVKPVLILFCLLELSNAAALYFAPGTRYANAVGVFRAWEQSKQYPEIHDLVRYLVYWVAGAKLIFLLLLAVIVIFGDVEIQRLSLAALALGTASFFWRLYPLIRKMDRGGQIEPENYSKVLGLMILVFIAAFILAALV